MTAAPSVRWLWLTAAVVGADRATKYFVEHFTREGFRRELVPKLAALVHSINPGVAFGMLSDATSRWISVLLIVGSLIVVSFLAWMLATGRVGTASGQAGVAMIAGGAAGNMLDRLLHGGVTDFVELHAGSFYWPAFNLADAAIVIGALLLAYELIGTHPHTARESH